MATTSSGPLPHPRDCAQRVRGRSLAAAGDPAEPGPVLVADIAREIITCCGHTSLKAFRLAHGWTVDAAVAAVHDLCRSRRFTSPGLTARSWKEWEAGGRVSPGYQDLLCRLFQTGPVQLGLACDYSPGPARLLRDVRREHLGVVRGERVGV